MRVFEMKHLGLLCLNEVNFDLVFNYVTRDPGKFPNLEFLISAGIIKTASESEYDLLEPWIQWPSVQTGLNYSGHKVFRLGDINNFEGSQIYERIENLGVRVGAVSPMNAANRLTAPAYFIPDPWTKTPCAGSRLVKRLYHAIRQAVGDNASGKIDLISKIYILIGLIRFSRLKAYPKYFSILKSIRSIPGSKALILDLLLSELHLTLFKKYRPGFTQLFLNSFAHIQHHYFLSSKTDIVNSEIRQKLTKDGGLHADPFPQALMIYDWIIGEFIALMDGDVIMATGLSQLPYDRIKYYYRLKDHEYFLRDQLKLDFLAVNALMTRDFVITFDSEQHAKKAQELLCSVKVKDTDKRIFGEVQNRGDSLFVTLTYGDFLDEKLEVCWSNGDHSIQLEKHVVFVAIKNGMHNDIGYAAVTNPKLKRFFVNGMHVSNIGKIIYEYFEKKVL